MMHKHKETQWILNGERVTGRWDEHETLLSVLRQEFHLCSVKQGCDSRECGSCTVLVDGKAEISCDIPVHTLAHRSVLTWEGMASEIRQRYSQELAKAGMSCGFCIPGMLMRWHGAAAEEHRPSRSFLIDVLSQHFCRCTGYSSWLSVLPSVSMSAAKQHPPTLSLRTTTGMANVSRFRDNSGTFHLLDRLLAGEPFYVDDLFVPCMLEAAVVWTPQAFGTLEQTEWKSVLQQDGVAAVLCDQEEVTLSPAYREEQHSWTQGDSAVLVAAKDSSLRESFVGLSSAERGFSQADLAALSEWQVEHSDVSALSTSPSALVESAVSLEGAEAWKKEVHVLMVGDEIRWCGEPIGLVVAEQRKQARYAATQAEVRVVSRLEPTWDVEYAYQREWGKVASSLFWKYGDVDTAFREAATVVSGTWNTSSVDAASLELPSCLVVPLQQDILCHVYTSGVSASWVRQAVAYAIHCEPSQVEVTILPTGGCVGMRTAAWFEPSVAKLAMALKRPVKLTLGRQEAIRLLPKRHSMRIHTSLACDEQGKLMGLRMHVLGDTGGLAIDAERVLRQTLAHACGPYRIPAFAVEGQMLCSNLPHAGQVFEDGVLQIHHALESTLELMSQHLGIDGWMLRYHNVLQPGDPLPNGQTVGADCRNKECLDAIRESFYKYESHVGIACAWMGCDEIHPQGTEIQVRLFLDGEGFCHIALPRAEYGQGLYARVLEVVSEEAHWPPEQIVLDVSPSMMMGVPSWESHSAHTWAILQAARQAAQQLRKAPSSSSPTQRVFVGFCILSEPPQHPNPIETQSNFPVPMYRTHSFATQVIALHPDHRDIQRIVTVCDVGTPSAREIALQQIEGAIVRGLGTALSERVISKEGMPVCTTLRDLGCVSPEAVPHLQTYLVCDSLEHGVFSEKGGEQVAMITVSPAFAAALYRVTGKRTESLPSESWPTKSHISSDDTEQQG